jgi:dipeptidase
MASPSPTKTRFGGWSRSAGHHWIARRVKDEEYVVMPNQFGLDRFDLADAYGAKKENLCSSDLQEFVEKNHLNLALDGSFNPRVIFGSHDDSDHVYNTPRAWFMERYLNPRTYVWEGKSADFTPESDDIPWSLVPEKKITIEDVKYVLSSHFQGTPYDPYSKVAYPQKGIYRPIGISRTAFLSIHETRGDVDPSIASVEWIAFASNAFNAIVPLYGAMKEAPEYFGNTTMDRFHRKFLLVEPSIGRDGGFAFQPHERPHRTLPRRGGEFGLMNS